MTALGLFLVVSAHTLLKLLILILCRRDGPKHLQLAFEFDLVLTDKGIFSLPAIRANYDTRQYDTSFILFEEGF